MDCSYASRGDSTIWGRPVVRAWVRNHPIKAMLDSGCAQSLVWVDLVPPQMDNGALSVKIGLPEWGDERVE